MMLTFLICAEIRGQELAAINGPPPPVPPAVVARDPEGRLTVRAVRTDQTLSIDGVLDDTAYAGLEPITGFIQQEPREGEPCTERTEIWLLFDNRHIYVAGRVWYTDPRRIVANELRRDNLGIFDNDNITVVFDTFYDRRTGFFFQTNALGGIREGLTTEEGRTNYDWQTAWDVRSRRFEQGWTFEMAIPFKSLRYKGEGRQIWGFNVRRVIRWKGETAHLTPIPASWDVRGVTKFSSAATLVGLETPAAALNLELKPYAIADLKTDRQAAPPVTTDPGAHGGVDVKYGLTRSLAMDLTYNTDFAQVEIDEQQVNLTRFSLFFPEKREFFLESQGIFEFGNANSRTGSGDTPIMFFSRRIGLNNSRLVPIRGGGQLTGRAGKYTVGLLNIQTGKEPLASAVSTNYSALRVRRDLLRRSNVGIIATNRSRSAVGSGGNRLAGVDGNFAFYDNLHISLYWAVTDTPGLQSGSTSYMAKVEYAADKYGLTLERLAVGPSFNPEVGFLRREDFRRNYALVRYSPRPKSLPAVRKVWIESAIDYVTDNQGRLETRQVQLVFKLQFENGDEFNATATDNFEFVPRAFGVAGGASVHSGEYSFKDVTAFYELGTRRRLAGRVTAGTGGFFDGERSQASYEGRIEVNPRISLEPRIALNWIDLPAGRFTTRLLGSRGTFTLTPRLFVAALVQYNSSANTVDANVRFRWEYQPGSDLFVVYSEGRDTAVGNVPRVLSRALVVKFTRMFRF
jgi:hypothetical protein